MSGPSIAINLTLPEKLEPRYQPRRYKVMHGGRGGRVQAGSDSQSRGRR